MFLNVFFLFILFQNNIYYKKYKEIQIKIKIQIQIHEIKRIPKIQIKITPINPPPSSTSPPKPNRLNPPDHEQQLAAHGYPDTC